MGLDPPWSAPDHHTSCQPRSTRQRRFTLENLTGLQRMPADGGWIVVGGPRNKRGSGAPSTIFGLTR
jgi:kynurenine formamidase